MINHKLMPKHGEQVLIADANAEKIIKHICKMQREASVDLGTMVNAILINDKTQMVMVPCKQCVLDIALQFYDLSEALKGLADGK